MPNNAKNSKFAPKIRVMEFKERKIVYKEYLSIEELPEKDASLVRAAIGAASSGSYSPYSGFRVGAAVRMSGGDIVIGANQENVAYPSGLCAERTALFYAHASHPEEKVVAIAIAAINRDGIMSSPVYPCGACCQVMLETQKRSSEPLHIILYGKNRTEVVEGAESLLPFSFETF